MALVKVTLYRAVFELRDEAGNKSTKIFNVVGATHATALTNAQTILGDLNAVTDALVFSYSVAERYVEDTEQYGAAGSEVENLAEVVCPIEVSAGDPAKFYVERIPAPNIGLFQGASGPEKNLVDLTDAALVSYLENLTDETGYGTPGPDAIALISDGEKIKPDDANERPFVTSGKRVHRASRKG